MAATEKHYTTSEVAAMWSLHPKTVHRLFLDEPGVLRIQHPRLKTKRQYVTLRIPESVLSRFHEQRSGGFLAERRGRR